MKTNDHAELDQIMAAVDNFGSSAREDGELGFIEMSDHTKALRDVVRVLIESMMQDRERALAQIRIRQMGELL